MAEELSASSLRFQHAQVGGGLPVLSGVQSPESGSQQVVTGTAAGLKLILPPSFPLVTYRHLGGFLRS